MGGRRVKKESTFGESDESDFAQSEEEEEEEEVSMGEAMKVEVPDDLDIEKTVDVTVEPEIEWVRRSTRTRRNVKKEETVNEEGDLGFAEEGDEEGAEEEESAKKSRGKGKRSSKKMESKKGEKSQEKEDDESEEEEEDDASDDEDDNEEEDDASDDKDDNEEEDDASDDEEFMDDEEYDKKKGKEKRSSFEEKNPSSKKSRSKANDVSPKKTERTISSKTKPRREGKTKAPGKGKGKGSAPDAGGSGGRGSVPESEASSIILEYIKNQNRPFNTQNVHDNLQGSIKKPICQRVLDRLATHGEITLKEFGKAKVYYADQSKFEEPDAEVLKQMDDEIEGKTSSLKDIQKTMNEMKSRIASLSSSMTTAEMREKIDTSKKKIESMKIKLQRLEGSSELVDPRKKEEVTKKLQKYEKEWKKRRRMCLDIVDAVSEGMGKKPSQVKEEAAIECDEEAGVTLEPPNKRRKK
eukprot:TRINITY_DN1367_c0_g2_i3.p1 TRINITY_DN1367_c0_g2~~TRINITY_DN1367_c0_g2_i3.p1  ORF type:complete len:467 (-),score=236.99 TRINITY_DN1367_c0_g2_i3:212-1612(-)